MEIPGFKISKIMPASLSLSFPCHARTYSHVGVRTKPHRTKPHTDKTPQDKTPLDKTPLTTGQNPTSFIM